MKDNHVISSDRVEGSAVYNVNGDKLGSIDDLMIDKLTGQVCSGQVISDSLMGFFDVDSRSKALGDRLPSFECSLTAL